MNIRLRQVVLTFTLFLAAIVGNGAHAQDWDRWDRDAETARSLIEANEASSEALTKLRQRLQEQREDAQKLAAAAAEDIKRLTEETEALGPAPAAGETAELANLRADLEKALAEARALQGKAQRGATRATALLADLTTLEQRRFLNRMTARGPTPLNPARWTEAGEALSSVAAHLQREAARALETETGQAELRDKAPDILITILGAMIILLLVRRVLVSNLTGRAVQAITRGRRLALGLSAGAARLVLTTVAAVLLAVGLSMTGLFGQVGEFALRGFAEGLVIISLAYALSAALFAPGAAALRLPSMNDADARRAFRLSILLGAAIALESLLQRLVQAIKAPESVVTVFAFVTVLLAAYAFWRLTEALRSAFGEEGDHSLTFQAGRLLRRAARITSVIAPVLAAAGYYGAATFILFSTIISVALIAACFLIFAIVQEAVEIFVAEDAKPKHRLRLLPVLVGASLLFGALPLLALIWGADSQDLNAAYAAFADGLVIGDVAVSPMDFITFALVFALGYTLTRGTQRVLHKAVLPKTSVSDGGASALTAGIGYLGIFLSALIAISATGLDLSSLAIVAGALSVGVGFGLQTIVSNFVSGVILLIERPIKPGDWIEVGGASGYVKQVNVRSTEIETFDRASYIIPNSDLIAGAVLNWTHSDKTGRVRAPVGVAYGTDARKVERILLEIAAAHKMVLSSPAPSAYFMRFGADALEFELRVYLRDVNWMLSVASDLNFAIAERFAAEGIEIPYAQRDITIRNAGELGQALRTGGAPDDQGA